MPNPLFAEKAMFSISPEFRLPVNLLGGDEVVRAHIQSAMDVHELILRGLPRETIRHLSNRTTLLRNEDFLRKALGFTVRTTQRHRDNPDALLSEEQSGRTWKFAEILGKAIHVLGSQEEAERWLSMPAIGLNQHRPIDLLSTPTGTDLVETLLTQMEYGVFA